MVDIFEAGPIVQCQMKDIRMARESRKEKIVQIADGPIDSPPLLIHAGAPRYRTTIVRWMSASPAAYGLAPLAQPHWE